MGRESSGSPDPSQQRQESKAVFLRTATTLNLTIQGKGQSWMQAASPALPFISCFTLLLISQRDPNLLSTSVRSLP